LDEQKGTHARRNSNNNNCLSRMESALIANRNDAFCHMFAILNARSKTPKRLVVANTNGSSKSQRR
jgi:hypothetical protein